MRQMFYSQRLLEQQQYVLRKKRIQFWLITAIWVLLTAATFLLQTRKTRVICTMFNGLTSGAYFSWLLYFLTYAYKKEREYFHLIQAILCGRQNVVVGTVKRVEIEENPMEQEYRLCFALDDLQEDLRMYRLSGRVSVQPQQWVDNSLALYVYEDRITGIEVSQ